MQTEIERIVDRAAAIDEVPADVADRRPGPVARAAPTSRRTCWRCSARRCPTPAGTRDASSVEVVVSAGDEIVVRVTDDGKGMDEEVLESGLGNMRERAHKHGGTFSVQSALRAQGRR